MMPPLGRGDVLVEGLYPKLKMVILVHLHSKSDIVRSLNHFARCQIVTGPKWLCECTRLAGVRPRTCPKSNLSSKCGGDGPLKFILVDRLFGRVRARARGSSVVISLLICYEFGPRIRLPRSHTPARTRAYARTGRYTEVWYGISSLIWQEEALNGLFLAKLIDEILIFRRNS